MRVRLKHRFWEPEPERMGKRELERLQDRRLRGVLRYVYRNSRFYRSALKGAGVDPESVRSSSDLSRIPFTAKEDLRDNYPFGLLATPTKNIARFHISSGTTGNPTVVAYTAKDLESWMNCIARCLAMTGVWRGDVFQVILGYGLFTGGLGFHYGAERVGASVVPSSTGNTKRQVKLMNDFGVTAFTSTPSYALYLAEVAEEGGVDPARDLRVKTISCGAEAWSEGVRRRIESTFDCPVFNSYGLSEMGGPGVAFECQEQKGLHVWSDHFLVEVVDPETGEVLGLGEEGELVLTTLTGEAMPLLRYRTRDIAAILDEGRCECGRSHTRISWIRGRTDDMVKVRGVNVFPSQVEEALTGLPDVGGIYQLVLTRKGYRDNLTVRVEVGGRRPRLGSKELLDLKGRLQEGLQSALGLRLSVEVVKPGSIPRVEGKAQRVLDLRSKQG